MPNFLNNIKRLRKNEKGVIPLILAALGIVLLVIVIIIAIIAVVGFVGYFSGKEQPVEASAGGCYLIDSAFTETTTITNADEVIQKLNKWPQIRDKKPYIEKIITESKNAGINPALLLAIWSGEQSFGNPNAAFGCGVYGGRNRYPGFDAQLSCSINCIKDAMNNKGSYTQPSEANIFTRLFYNYTGSMQAFYNEHGYVADDSNARIVILKALVPDEVTCTATSSEINKEELKKSLQDMLDKGISKNNSSANNARIAEPYLTTITVPIWNGQTQTTMKIRAHKDVAGSLGPVFNDLLSIKFPIDAGNTGAWRAEQGAGGSSCESAHLFGIAIDVNVNENPYCRSCSQPNSPRAITPEVVSIFKKHGWVVWGGTWSSVKDYMHFSVNGPEKLNPRICQ